MKSFILSSFCLLFSIFTLQAQVAKRVIVEHFTNTKCPICKNRNPGFYTNLNNHPEVLHLSVHPSSPYASCVLSQQLQPDNDERTKYYGVYGSTPRLVIQGTPISANADYNSASLFAPYLNKTSPVEINVIQTKFGADSIHAKIIIKTVASNSLGSLKLFGALAEDTVFYTGSNGEKEHYDVYRKSLFGSTGKSITIPANVGDSVIYEVSSPSNSIWNFERIYTLIILQDATTKEVIQTFANSPDDNGIITNTKIVYKELDFNVYPNPSRSVINIELDNSDNVSATLYSLDGRLILKQELSGNGIMDVSHLSKATYLLELRSDNAKGVKKIQVK